MNSTKFMRLRHLSIAILVLYVLVIILFAVLPGNTLGDITQTNDKLLHFFEFFVFTTILLTTLHYFDTKKMYLKALTISFGVVLVSEIVQLFTPLRTFSVYDIIADLVGVGLAMLLVFLARMKK